VILVLNGPNLNLLGQREPGIYGTGTLEELEQLCQAWGAETGVSVVCHQSNYEGQLLDWLHRAAEEGFKAAVFNPGGLAHTSVVLRDAIAGIRLPVIEVHISNLYTRERFRHHSFISSVCEGTISGLGVEGYGAAIRFLARQLGKREVVHKV
jgi:3-dehydroquinate dehydratase-2